MPDFKDQIGNIIRITKFPKKIISLVPSQTELLYYLGLNDEVTGITKFCVHPKEWFISKNRVGGTKNLNLKLIHQLQPDLVIANKEENEKSQVEELAKTFPVWTSDVNNLPDALQMINALGEITNTSSKASILINEIKLGFNSLKKVTTPCRAAYLIWKEPYMIAGGDTFINAMMEAAGFQNIFADQRRYPQVTEKDLQNSDCNFILLSSEPYPFKQKHILQLRQLLPNVKILLVDGEMFSWYGSRLLMAPAYFKNLFTNMQDN